MEWLGKNRVRLFFATGKILEVALPIRSAKNARVVYGGVGVDPGDGYELSASTLHDMPGMLWRLGAEAPQVVKASRSRR